MRSWFESHYLLCLFQFFSNYSLQLLFAEWAKEDETLDDVRKRTADHFKAGDQRVKRAKQKKQFLKSLTSDVGV